MARDVNPTALPAAGPPQRMWSQYFLGCYYLGYYFQNYWRRWRAERPHLARNEPAHQQVGAPGPSRPHHTHQVRWLTSFSLRPIPSPESSDRYPRLGRRPRLRQTCDRMSAVARETIRPDARDRSYPRDQDAHYVTGWPARQPAGPARRALLVEFSPGDWVRRSAFDHGYTSRCRSMSVLPTFTPISDRRYSR